MPARKAGYIARRCECRDEDGKLLSSACPKLARKNHGSLVLQVELPPTAEGRRRRFRRAGYSTVTDAKADLSKVQSLLDLAGADEDAARRVADLLQGIQRTRADIPDPAEVRRRLGVGIPLDGSMTISDWLDVWLAGKKKARTTTLAGYTSHIRVHLKPRIGHLRLDRLTVGHLDEMFDAIADESDTIRAENAGRREQEARARWPKPGRPPAGERARLAAERAKLAEMPPYRKANGPATRQAIRSTLRTALNAAIARQLITFNAAAHVELDAAPRPKGLLWTDERVARWRTTGAIPSAVMVWNPEQLGAFLDAAEGHRLYAGFHLMAHHGLRRGECVGQGWDDTYLDGANPRMEVLTEIVVDGWTPIETPPKTDGSMAAVTLDSLTVQVLRERKEIQATEREAWNAAAAERRRDGDKEAYDWIDTGKIFTSLDGSWLHPDVLSREFAKVYTAAGLPPVNIRDLRHVAAGLVKAGGGDIDDAKAKLRHKSIRLTSDTYMALFTEYEQALAERSAAAVPRARRPAASAGRPDLRLVPGSAGPVLGQTPPTGTGSDRQDRMGPDDSLAHDQG